MLAIQRRTFEAAKHPKGSELRQAANLSAVTSEYYTGSPYILICTNAAGERAWTQLFRTKAEAERIKAGLEKAEKANA